MLHSLPFVQKYLPSPDYFNSIAQVEIPKFQIRTTCESFNTSANVPIPRDNLSTKTNINPMSETCPHI